MTAYAQYLAGNLTNYSLPEEEIEKSLADADSLNR